MDGMALHWGIGKLQISSSGPACESMGRTLEEINIFRTGPAHSEMGHLGLLRGLAYLKHLRIQVEVMLGGCLGAPRAQFAL